MRASDPAAQLMQLGEAELVGAMHDDSVRRRHVDAGFDDGGAEQDVRALRHEIAHYLFQVAFMHLTVGDGDARFGQQLFQHRLAVLDGFDFVMQEIHLSAALQFAQAGFANHRVVLAAHEGLDRKALLRCGGDDGEIAQAFQRHAERARDRRCRQRQHIDFGAQGFQRFFLAHAKAVLFIDDHQAETGELHFIRQQLVGADHDVDRAFGESLDCCSDFLAGAEARQLCNLHRPVGEAIGKRGGMLFCQQRGRREDGNLLAAHDSDEGRAQSHLGLAEADIAADQAIHRFAAGHVLDDGIDRGALVGRFLETEAFGEGFVVARGILEGVALAGGAAGIQVEQLGRGVANLLRCLALCLFPLAGAKRVQRRIFRRGTRVARDDVQL